MAVAAPVGSQRLAALAIVALMVLLPAIWIGWSVNTASVLSDSIGDQSETLAGLKTRLAALKSGAAGDQARMASVYLPGQTPAIAGAALQELVAAAVDRVGGRIAESEIIRSQTPEQDKGTVSLRASFETDIVGLQQLLFELETGAPILMVRSLSVSAPTAIDTPPDQSPTLNVMMTVSGYQEA